MMIKGTLSILLLILLFQVQLQLGLRLVKPPVEIPMEETALTLNENFIRIFNLGHSRFFAAITWVVTLIEGDIEHYKKKDGNSWMFHRFKSISIYDPLFYENYLYGGQYLSIIKDDLKGAEYLFDKGLQFYPNDYGLNYHAGFNSFFEMGNAKKAIGYFENLMKLPNILNRFPILPSLLTKIRYNSGDEEGALDKLQSLYDQLPQGHFQRKTLFSTLYTLRAKRDLKCLNNNSDIRGCSKVDFEGIPYKKEKGLYIANRDLRKLSIKNSKN